MMTRSLGLFYNKKNKLLTKKYGGFTRILDNPIVKHIQSQHKLPKHGSTQF